MSLADSFIARLTDPGMPRAERVPALLHRHLHRLAQGRYAAAWAMLRDAITAAGGRCAGMFFNKVSVQPPAFLKAILP